jgi:hypothetical protein
MYVVLPWKFRVDRVQNMWHSCYKFMTSRGRSLITHKKLRYFPNLPRLQRLFMSPKTVEHMTWHQSHDVVDRVMVHPFDGEAWKYFNSIYPQFSVEIKNACFKSCINKFNPIRSFIASYSCWPVIFTVYNLSPKMFMRLEFIFFYLRSCLVLRVQVGI